MTIFRLRKSFAVHLLTLGPAVLVAFGCASKSILPLHVPNEGSNAADGVVRVTRVGDHRSLSTELELSEAERRHAVAAYGKRIELLPPEQTVDSIVKELVAQGFRRAMHSTAGDQSGNGEPIPVEVDIEEFWGTGWQADYSFRLRFDVALKITAPTGRFRAGRLISGKGDRGTYYPPIARLFGGPRTDAWTVVIEEGCAQLVENLVTELKQGNRETGVEIDNPID
jgi:hypothetical protein